MGTAGRHIHVVDWGRWPAVHGDRERLLTHTESTVGMLFVISNIRDPIFVIPFQKNYQISQFLVGRLNKDVAAFVPGESFLRDVLQVQICVLSK